MEDKDLLEILEDTWHREGGVGLRPIDWPPIYRRVFYAAMRQAHQIGRDSVPRNEISF